MMEGEPEILTTLQRLKKLGVRLAIDDFGMGYSSLAYLKPIPINTFKIGRSFIQKPGLSYKFGRPSEFRKADIGSEDRFLPPLC